jgi:hypothetical protein
LIRGIENDAKLEAAQIIKRIETEALSSVISSPQDPRHGHPAHGFHSSPRTRSRSSISRAKT